MFSERGDGVGEIPSSLHGPLVKFAKGVFYTFTAFSAAFALSAAVWFNIVKPAMTFTAWVAGGFAAVPVIAWVGLGTVLLAGGLLYVSRARGTLSKKK